MQHTTIHISIKTLLSLLVVGVGVFLFLQLWNIALIVFTAMILAALIDPFATWFEQRRIPRVLAAVIVYVLLLGIVSAAVYLLAPVITSDLPQLIAKLEALWQDIASSDQFMAILQGLEQIGIVFDPAVQQGSADTAGRALTSVFGAVSSIFEGLAAVVLILVIALYMVTEEEPLHKITNSIIPEKYVGYIVSLLSRIRDKLAFWIRAQLVLSLVVGISTFVGLSLMGVRYAAALALIAALLEFVPYLGPIIAAVPALIIAFTQGGAVLLLVVFVFYAVVQQLENHILVPKIMQKAVGLNPIVSIVALLIGAQLEGILGALLAIPVATALRVIIIDVISQKTTT